jgi:glycosyltransferase involved in cell wall biosynthesis
MAPTLDITIVVPVYNEAQSLRELYEEIVGACSGLGRS